MAEVQLLANDIETAFYEIQLWRTKYAPRNSMSREERALSTGLFRDAIVQFVGCFDKTAEFSLRKEDIYKTPEELEFFQWLQDLRDAFAAHKFGPYRQCVVGVTVKGGERRIGFKNQIFTGYLSDLDSRNIQAFIAEAGMHLALRAKELIRQLLDSLKPVTDDELNALPMADVHEVSSSEVRMSRAAFQRARTGKGPSKRRSSRSTKKSC